MKVGILGGSFNPPHQGHIYISNLAQKKAQLNQIWWIPTWQNPLKDLKTRHNFEERFSKCKNLTKKYPKIRVLKFNYIYAEKLLENLNKKFPKIEFFWVMGSDNIKNLHKWKNYKNFIKDSNLLIFSRETYDNDLSKSKSWKIIKNSNYRFFKEKKVNISSSKIRNNEI
jgi:nicotinate-nucleotide adenylyltransferase